MKQLFYIAPSPAEASANDALLIEAGSDYISYALANNATKAISEINYYTFASEAYEHLNDILQQLKTNAFEKVVIASAFPQAILVPDKFYSPDNVQHLLQPVYDITHHLVLDDAVARWHLHTVYAFPKKMQQLNNNYFPNANYIHAYSVALKNDTINDDQHIAVHFTTTQFRVKVKKDQRLQLMQTFSFQTPLDVVYVLLKIGEELGLKQEDTPVILSGLIDEQSDLYKELYNYFLHLQFAGIAEDIVLKSDYPPHFFTSLYQLASCVL